MRWLYYLIKIKLFSRYYNFISIIQWVKVVINDLFYHLTSTLYNISPFTRFLTTFYFYIVIIALICILIPLHIINLSTFYITSPEYYLSFDYNLPDNSSYLEEFTTNSETPLSKEDDFPTNEEEYYSFFPWVFIEEYPHYILVMKSINNLD